ncbi:unnamed protein product [Periconia digitata]|uniref:ferric-chelate reductase (NADPH) n=1 Tax=Periconia digitata TaxID=1303443 RepID=A0A9W4XP79_9PLEO|nr:unnamed protein product [Periconia digitata]
MAHSNHAAMGSMAMGGAAPLIDYPKFYWAVVGSAIGVATLANVYNQILFRQRLSAAKTGSLQPAKPKAWPLVAIATTYAITREFSNYSLWLPIKSRMLRLPTLGRSSLIIINVIVLLVLGLSDLDLFDMYERETVGYRLGFVSIAQLPLIFLLAGKNNIIGSLTGIGYERLNWLHRWCARCLLLTATLHMGYFLSAWAPFDYIGTQLKENTLVWKGLVAWVMLVWIVFSSVAPIRGWCYEFFVVQHLVSFAVMIGFIYIHTPEEVHIYVWLPVGIFFFDRVLRVARLLYANLSFFHPRRDINGLLACKAEFTPLAHGTTRVVIQNPPISWTPGQHVFLSCHSLAPLQSHPFTIASLPKDGKMELLIKSETGGTHRFFKHAEKAQSLHATTDRRSVKTVTVEGPYGTLRPLRQFDSVVLLAGSTGATFVVPLLRDIIQGWKENVAPAQPSTSFFQRPRGAVTRYVRFVWVVKSQGQLAWFSEQLSTVYSDFQNLQEQARDIKLEMTVYVTCDESFTEEHQTLLPSMTSPNPNAQTRVSAEPEHGSVQYRNNSPMVIDEKSNQNTTKYGEAIREVPSNSTSNSAGLNKSSCCCKTTIDESASPDAIQTVCRCGEGNPPLSAPQALPSSPSSSSSSEDTPRKPVPPSSTSPPIRILSGRPHPRSLIRRSLEQARGEAAVVACGPEGLLADVRRDVVALSDERAVHKGTGAQGIFLHTEGFGW